MVKGFRGPGSGSGDLGDGPPSLRQLALPPPLPTPAPARPLVVSRPHTGRAGGPASVRGLPVIRFRDLWFRDSGLRVYDLWIRFMIYSWERCISFLKRCISYQLISKNRTKISLTK